MQCLQLQHIPSFQILYQTSKWCKNYKQIITLSRARGQEIGQLFLAITLLPSFMISSLRTLKIKLKSSMMRLYLQKMMSLVIICKIRTTWGMTRSGCATILGMQWFNDHPIPLALHTGMCLISMTMDLIHMGIHSYVPTTKPHPWSESNFTHKFTTEFEKGTQQQQQQQRRTYSSATNKTIGQTSYSNMSASKCAT